MQWSRHQCSLASERGLTVAQYHQRKALSKATRKQSSRGDEYQTSTRDQGPSRAAGRSSSSTDSMSEASA
eukprot:4782267-Prymnesium_polylepis.1